MYSKELTETRNEAPKHRNELLDTEPYLTISLDYPSVLRSRPKGCRSKWKVENSFWKSIFFLVRIRKVF